MFDCDKLTKQRINPLTGRKINPSKATYKKLIDEYCSGANDTSKSKTNNTNAKANKNRKQAFLEALDRLPIGMVSYEIGNIDETKFKTLYTRYLKRRSLIMSYIKTVTYDYHGCFVTNTVIVAMFLRIDLLISKIPEEAPYSIMDSLIDEAYRDVVVVLPYLSVAKSVKKVVIVSKYDIYLHNRDKDNNKKIKVVMDNYDNNLIVIKPIDKGYMFFSDEEFKFLLEGKLPECDSYIHPRFYEFIWDNIEPKKEY